MTNNTQRSRELSYMRARTRNRVHGMLVDIFTTEQREIGLLKKDLAERTLRHPAQITRWLSAPSNMSLNVLSDLLFAMGLELDLRVEKIEPERTRHLQNMIVRLANEGSNGGSGGFPAPELETRIISDEPKIDHEWSARDETIRLQFEQINRLNDYNKRLYDAFCECCKQVNFWRKTRTKNIVRVTLEALHARLHSGASAKLADHEDVAAVVMGVADGLVEHQDEIVDQIARSLDCAIDLIEANVTK